MEIREITSETEFLNEIKNNRLVLVDFYAKWCAPCKMQSPILYEFYKGVEDKISVVKADVDENAKISSEYGVNSIPTLILFCDGVAVEKRVGLNSKSQLSEMVIKHL